MPCLIWVLLVSMHMLRTCAELHGGGGLAEMCGDVRLVRMGRGVGLVGLSMPNILHMPNWGKLNLPVFLFNVRLLTLINIDSSIVLAKPWPSLPIIWKLF